MKEKIGDSPSENSSSEQTTAQAKADATPPPGEGQSGQNTAAPTGRRGLNTVTLVTIIFFVAIAGTVFLLIDRILDAEPPLIEAIVDLPSINATPRPLVIRVSDARSGLGRLQIVLKQDSDVRSLITKELHGEHEYQESLTLDARAMNLKQSPAEIYVEAQDRAFTTNSSSKRKLITVDFTVPQLEVIALQSPIEAGGTGTAVIRAIDSGLTEVFLSTADQNFRAVPASGIDPNFKQGDTFIAFFSARNPQNAAAIVKANDAAGNSTSLPVPLEVVAPTGGATHTITVSAEAIVGVAKAELPGRLASLPQEERQRGEKILNDSLAGSRNANRELITYLYSTLFEYQVANIAQVTQNRLSVQKRWDRQATIASSQPQVTFRDTLTFSDDQGPLTTWNPRSVIYDIPPQSDALALAPFDGTVRSTKDLGLPLGKSVVIDHGAGVSTVLWGLEYIHADEGATVKKGQDIGQLGAFPGTTTRQLRIMVLIHGIPVEPAQWLEPQGYLRSVESLLNKARRALGIPTVVFDQSW